MVNPLEMLSKLVWPSERINSITATAGNGTWEGYGEMTFHVTLHLKVAVQQLVRCTTSNSTL